jgi:hypothetical protein
MPTPEPTSDASSLPHTGEPTTSPILVGVSVVTGSRAALQWAAQEARLRRTRVRAVMAWRSSGLPGGAPGRPPGIAILDSAPEQRLAEQTLEEFVVDALGEDHGVECEAVEGSARDVLLSEAANAALLVLDSPAVSKLYDPRSRRLAPKILFRSACPVVVMPPLEPEAGWEEEEPDEAEDVGEPGAAASAPASS